jgi:hypothetical protein
MMSLRQKKKEMIPIKEHFEEADVAEKKDIVNKLKLMNALAKDDLKLGQYNKETKEDIKKSMKPIEKLEEELEKKID